MTDRKAQLAAGLSAVRQRIADALRDAGRDRDGDDGVTLIVVTKFFPADDVRALHDLGVRDVGENRHQEASAKAAELADLDLSWHFVGNLQSNKAAEVAGYADAVHSVDRAKLINPLGKGARGVLDCLIQVDLDPEPKPGRGGARPELVVDLADRIESADHLALRGLMAVAPLGEEPASAFGRLAEIRSALLRDHPQATWLSAGMSHDLEAAVSAGATHVRVGSAILGPRPPIP